MASPLDDWPLSTFRIQTIATHSSKQVSCTSLNCGRLSNSQSRKYNFFFFFRTFYSRSIWNPLRNRSSNLSLPPHNPTRNWNHLSSWILDHIMNFPSIHSLIPKSNTSFLGCNHSLNFAQKLPRWLSFSPSISSFGRASLQIWSIESLD